MGVISNGDESVWGVARWAFAGYLNHVLAEVREDATTAYAVEQAIALDGLHLDLEDVVTVQRLRPVLVRVADEVVDGVRPVTVDGHRLDDELQDQFRKAVAELRALFTRWWPTEVPGKD